MIPNLDTKLAEIQAQVDKATPGQWYQFDNGGTIPDSTFPYGERYAAAVWGPAGPGHGVLAECAKHGMPCEQDIANARFIAHAPANLRFCLQTIAELREDGERLEKKLRHLKQYKGDKCGCGDTYCKICYAARGKEKV